MILAEIEEADADIVTLQELNHYGESLEYKVRAVAQDTDAVEIQRRWPPKSEGVLIPLSMSVFHSAMCPAH